MDSRSLVNVLPLAIWVSGIVGVFTVIRHVQWKSVQMVLILALPLLFVLYNAWAFRSRKHFLQNCGIFAAMHMLGFWISVLSSTGAFTKTSRSFSAPWTLFLFTVLYVAGLTVALWIFKTYQRKSRDLENRSESHPTAIPKDYRNR